VVICLEQGAETFVIIALYKSTFTIPFTIPYHCLHMVQLMPLHPKTPSISCLTEIQTGFIFLVLAYPGCPGKEAVKRVK